VLYIFFLLTVMMTFESFVNTFGRHQLELPGRYDKLKAFWEDKKGTLPVAGTGRSNRSSPFSDALPADLKVGLVMLPLTLFSAAELVVLGSEILCNYVKPCYSLY